MTLLTYIALVGSLLALALGFITVLGERGYGFDLRRGRGRRSKQRRGGRRSNDLARAAAK
jgi:hypothetical protein